MSYGGPSQDIRKSSIYRNLPGKSIKGMTTLCELPKLWVGIDWPLKLANKAVELFNNDRIE